MQNRSINRLWVTSALVAFVAGPAMAADPGYYHDKRSDYFEWDWSGVYVGASVGVTQALGGAGITYSNIDTNLGSGPNGSFANGMYSSVEVVGNYLVDYSQLPPGYVPLADRASPRGHSPVTGSA